MPLSESPIIWFVVERAQSPILLTGDPVVASAKLCADAHEHFVADTSAYAASAPRQWSMHLVAEMWVACGDKMVMGTTTKNMANS